MLNNSRSEVKPARVNIKMLLPRCSFLSVSQVLAYWLPSNFFKVLFLFWCPGEVGGKERGKPPATLEYAIEKSFPSSGRPVLIFLN